MICANTIYLYHLHDDPYIYIYVCVCMYVCVMLFVHPCILLVIVFSTIYLFITLFHNNPMYFLLYGGIKYFVLHCIIVLYTPQSYNRLQSIAKVNCLHFVKSGTCAIYMYSPGI